MKIPPINYEDLCSLGMDPNTGIEWDGASILFTISPPKLVRQLLIKAMSLPPPESSRIEYLRYIRDLILSVTDWTQVIDSPLSESQRMSWAIYRQSLRDLPANYSGEGPIPWPKTP